MMMPSHQITDLHELERIYGVPGAPSLLKETARLVPAYRAMVEASPFLVLATVGPEGLDCSPRGDAPGFVRVEGDATLLVPDRRGNNRIDSMRNIIRDPRVALLFLIPGVHESLRVNGRAAISADPALCARFEVDGRAPRTVLVVSIESVFFQCGRALLRSGLWRPSAERPKTPSAGTMLREASGGREGGADYDRGLPARQRATLN
jgi:hypothetical protein